MSSVSSVGGASLYSFLQSVTNSNQSSATAAASTNPTSTASSTENSVAGQAVKGSHHHRHGGNKDGLFAQLQQTVTSALQSAQQGGASPNQAIEDAIAKVFQNNNTAVSGASASNAGDPDAAQANTPASINATTSPGSPGSSSRQSFLQTLQSFGVNPQQFHQDLLGALQSGQSGNADPIAAFQSFPPGSIIDLTG